MLKFSPANVKIQSLSKVPSLAPFLEGKKKVYSFDLLSGWSCPYAQDCLSKVYDFDGKRTLKDGPHTQFRCFSASQEVVYTNVYKLRKANYDTLRAMSHDADMFHAINDVLPKNAGIVRIHVGGDFFNQAYMMAWLRMAWKNPNVLFYAYTKSLKFWANLREHIETTPNFILTASRGGRLDHMIDTEKFRSVKVVYYEDEAAQSNLEIDHDDSHAADPSKKDKDFALLIHGVQPAGSRASLAIKQLKAKGVKFSYSRKEETK
jgi:hypothetical protein